MRWPEWRVGCGKKQSSMNITRSSPFKLPITGQSAQRQFGSEILRCGKGRSNTFQNCFLLDPFFFSSCMGGVRKIRVESSSVDDGFGALSSESTKSIASSITHRPLGTPAPFQNRTAKSWRAVVRRPGCRGPCTAWLEQVGQARLPWSAHPCYHPPSSHRQPSRKPSPPSRPHER